MATSTLAILWGLIEAMTLSEFCEDTLIYKHETVLGAAAAANISMDSIGSDHQDKVQKTYNIYQDLSAKYGSGLVCNDALERFGPNGSVVPGVFKKR